MSHTLADECWGMISNPAATDTIGSSQSIAVRALDIIIATIALLVFSPLLVLLATMTFAVDRGAIFYAHPRRGHRGKRFPCLKFRTMSSNADEQLRHLLATCEISRTEWNRDRKLRNDPRIIPGGAFMRRMSLDELPQLFNVLRGDMSIVGPRPIVDEEISRYGRHYDDYCSVKPGLTGLWQISGRNNVSYRRRIACDVLYARNKSAVTDLRIIACTVPVVLLSKGAY